MVGLIEVDGETEGLILKLIDGDKEGEIEGLMLGLIEADGDTLGLIETLMLGLKLGDKLGLIEALRETDGEKDGPAAAATSPIIKSKL